MDLLQKFSQVEIRADTRITEADRAFCQKHQEAYQAALGTFRQLLALWKEACGQQRHVLYDSENPRYVWNHYLTSKKFPELDDIQVNLHILEIHKKFISMVVSYLNAAYHLTIDADAVEEKFIPSLKDSESEIVESVFQSLVLRYEDMIELILSWFDGRGFSEQAPYEMVMKCHRAAWRESDHQPNFEQKKNLVKILNGACCYRYARKEEQISSREQWVIDSDVKSILKSLAHFETGVFEEYPYEMDKLLSEESVLYEWWDLWEFENCEKLERIKLFKNGRMDIRFTNEGYARQFVADYLGTVW
ncbi:MAG: hypothetical protein K2P01_08725 [Oscillospiraceae bacterium]|nr:hypothetical protein [Oscillospiraceae bacterium]